MAEKSPKLKKLSLRHHKEVWFNQNTIIDLIAPCIECIEGYDAADKEIIGLLYGKKFAPSQGPQPNSYYVRRAYIIQEAEREKKSVTYKTWTKDKMNSFFKANFEDEYLGSFHLHTKGSPRLSGTDKKNFDLWTLKFIIFLKEKETK